jgi:long-chain fatty acid transport protein
MNRYAKLMPWAVSGILCAAALPAAGSGFGIGTQSGSGTGNAFAGGAAAADDASVAWFNPAGMTALPAGKQIAGALHFLRPSFKFQNNGSTGVFLAPGTGEGGDGGDWAYVPNGFFTTDITPNLRFGLALNVPFGLTTEYESGWRGRMTGLKSAIRTVNVNPSLAYKISDFVSVGGGFSVQKIDAELTSFTGAAASGNLTLDADDVGYGFNVGVTFTPAPGSRIGLAYRSAINYDLSGTASFSGTAGALLGSNVRADLKVPDSLSLSFLTALSPQWELMGDATLTRWSSVQQLAIIRTSATGAGSVAGSTLGVLPFLWSDVWRFALGANYRINDQAKLRLGVALDKTPTNDATRSPRLPDEDRTWVALGLQYRMSKASVLDIGYAHEFIRDATVRVDAASPTLVCPTHCLNGSFDNQADIISIQFSYSF